MYVIKMQYKDSQEPLYANENIIEERKKVKECYLLKDFSIKSLSKAQRLYKSLLMRSLNPEYDGWTGQPKEADYIALVELSNYAPHSEYQVIDYREFK